MSIFVLIVYGTALLLILAYSIVQFALVINYRRSKYRKDEQPPEDSAMKAYPFVTVQLPLYNELYVVERLLDAVAEFDYPKDRFEVQVLDDSSDESLHISKRKVAELNAQNIRALHITRSKREGFKAGALNLGLGSARGAYIAIFDADFIPDPSFLKRTIPAFSDPRIGMVQTRWGHLNENYSLLTRLQAFGLDAHFSVEQVGRNLGGHFINFNGTAGIWRKKCIEDAGGWEFDTLTEDLDLSYRAQLKGWKFKYMEHVVSPAELPVVMSALKNQQFRWTKGGAENFVKMKGKIIRNPKLSLKTKLHGLFHLFNSAIFLCVLATALFSVPVLFIKYGNPQYEWLFNISSLFLVCTTILLFFYWTSWKSRAQNPGRVRPGFFTSFVLFLSTSMGLSLHNSVAVIEGLAGKKSSFIRTPKFNVVNRKDNWKGNVYLKSGMNLLTIFEGVLALYFLFAIVLSFFLQEFGLLPFHVMLFWGFGFVFWLSVRPIR